MEYWLTRELPKLLQYSDWRNFKKVVEKAKESCVNARQKLIDRFVDANKTISMPKTTVKTNK